VAKGGGEGQTIGPRTGTPDVFISYASHDTAIADNVATALEGQGVKCWIAPRDVTPGAHYASEIVHAIDSAKAIVLILSQDAATSPHVLREIERATSKRHPVVTLRLDQAPLPAEFEYFLNTSQWLDATGSNDTRLIVARQYNATHIQSRRPLLWHLSGAALTIWLTHNWSNEQILCEASFLSAPSHGLIGQERVNDLHRVPSFDATANPRRSTSSLGVCSFGVSLTNWPLGPTGFSSPFFRSLRLAVRGMSVALNWRRIPGWPFS
jgi:hypothetical protein